MNYGLNHIYIPFCIYYYVLCSAGPKISTSPAADQGNLELTNLTHTQTGNACAHIKVKVLYPRSKPSSYYRLKITSYY